MEKIKTYLDSGVSLPKDLLQFCECFQFPYDSHHRSKKNAPKIAAPCELMWKEAHCTWNEAEFTWDESGNLVPERVKVLIGKNNLRDCKHIASRIYKGCNR